MESAKKKGDEVEVSEWRIPDMNFMKNTNLEINHIFKEGYSYDYLVSKKKMNFMAINKLNMVN